MTFTRYHSLEIRMGNSVMSIIYSDADRLIMSYIWISFKSGRFRLSCCLRNCRALYLHLAAENKTAEQSVYTSMIPRGTVADKFCLC